MHAYEAATSGFLKSKTWQLSPVSTGNMSHDSKYDLIVMERQKALLEVNNDEKIECRRQTKRFYSLSQSCYAISRNSQ